MSRAIYINIAAKDKAAAVDFYNKLGFEQNQEYSNQDGSAIVISDSIFLMVLTEDFFKTFTNRKVADARAVTETILSISADSKEEVDMIADKAVAAGGAPAQEAENTMEGMYVRNFQDLDGHMWEIVYMAEPS